MEEIFGVIYGSLAPSISRLGAHAFEQNKNVQDLVAEIESEKASSANARSFLAECKKAIECNEALIVQLLATVGRLSAKLGEATKDRSIQAKSADYQMLDNDSGVIADTDGGNFDVTVADPAKNKNKEFFLQNVGSSVAKLVAFGGELFSGETEISLLPNTPYPSIKFKSDGTDWILT